MTEPQLPESINTLDLVSNQIVMVLVLFTPNGFHHDLMAKQWGGKGGYVRSHFSIVKKVEPPQAWLKLVQQATFVVIDSFYKTDQLAVGTSGGTGYWPKNVFDEKIA